jgi:uncharacterized protein YjbI with pentapeptide repeats
MIKFDIRSRFTNDVICTANINCEESAPRSWKLRLAILWAIATKVSLQSANLQSADLQSANLRYANLRYADLQYANLRYANLQSADLQSANLQSANLQSANLQSANLRYADLQYANLRYADLRYADLQSADLHDHKQAQSPLQLTGLKWPVLISDKSMQIGCKTRTMQQWREISDAELKEMHNEACVFWHKHKAALLALCEVHEVKELDQK